MNVWPPAAQPSVQPLVKIKWHDNIVNIISTIPADTDSVSHEHKTLRPGTFNTESVEQHKGECVDLDHTFSPI